MKSNKLLMVMLLSGLLLAGCKSDKKEVTPTPSASTLDPTPSEATPSEPSESTLEPTQSATPTATSDPTTPTPSSSEEIDSYLVSIEINKDVTAYVLGSTVDYSDLSVTLIYSDGKEEIIGYDNFVTYNYQVKLYYDDEEWAEDTFTNEGNYLLSVTGEDEISIDPIIITVTNDGLVYPESVSLPNEISMVLGDVRQLEVNIEPSSTNVINDSWISSNENVVLVDENGLLTAVAVGNAIVTYEMQGKEEIISDTCEVSVIESQSSSIVVSDQTGEFVISTEDGNVSFENNVFRITSSGSYDAQGNIEEGQILIDAGDDDVVELNLNGATISNSSDSPIKVNNADKLEISAKKNTQNTIYDRRSTKVVDNDALGEGAISANCDLKLKGTGSLYVEGNYNNGVHTSKDLTLQKLTLQVKAYNNGLKGKDSLTIESGEIEIISTNGDGAKTEDTDISNSGKQRGTVTINSGNIEVYAAGDGIQAAYNFVMNNGSLEVYTYSFSSYTAKNANVSSYKGIKVGNELIVEGGNINVKTYDDGLHADYGNTLENGNKGLGNITINGGTINNQVNATSSRTVKGADSIHADNTLTINDGNIVISSAYEGLEANFVYINGGDITISANDDGINAAKKINSSPVIKVTGGKVDITMASGDTDGIDSNGSFTQTGGLIISRGAPNSTQSMASGLDCDGTASITGGTFIQLGPRETVPSLTNCYTLNYGSSAQSGGPGGWFRPGQGGPGGGGGNSSTSNPFSSGTWTIDGTELTFTVANGYSYYGCCIYSSLLSKGTTYTISNGTTSYSASAS